MHWTRCGLGRHFLFVYVCGLLYEFSTHKLRQIHGGSWVQRPCGSSVTHRQKGFSHRSGGNTLFYLSHLSDT
ncbi:hypothetical protein LDENG_00088990 [Lucifuga dentata]|nr:hypothetical protein LDENG_00088990 [Lucifuga dentata]